jgi:hypothetical protein
MLAFNCNSQNKEYLFDQYIKKFKIHSLPITDEIINRNNLAANNPCNITKQEFDSFVKNDNNKFWIYRMYSKQQPDYFNYVAGLKFNLKDNVDLIALIYFRAYLPDDIADIKSEEILSIFNKNGHLVSSMPIGGSYDDTLTFSSTIYDSKKIEVNYIKSLLSAKSGV